MAGSASGRRAGPTRKRYDRDLIRDRTLELLAIRLGPPKDQGARLVWDCPDCGKHEKYSVKKADGKGGCLVADCRLAGHGDVFAMLAGLENLDYRADFPALLARSYELLGLEPATTSRTSSKATGSNSASQITGPKKAHTGDPAADANRPPAAALPVQTAPAKNSYTSNNSPQERANGGSKRERDALLALAARVYARILELCPLESRDRVYLRERGISYDTIRKGRFGTMTGPRSQKIKAELQREFGREELLRVPGFSYDEAAGRLKFTLTGNYILIPYHDRNGNITTIEGRVVGQPPEGMGKYVSLRRAGNHLYLFPGQQPEELLAVCEGAMGAIVAADSGLAVGAIMGCERFKVSPSAEMLDGGPEDPLLELTGVDFGGRTVPYIPDADDPPNPNVLRAAPKAARWVAEPQNGTPAICLLPEGADLDEWLLTLDPSERSARFTELLAGANPPEDVVSVPLLAPSVDAPNDEPPSQQEPEAGLSSEAPNGKTDQDSVTKAGGASQVITAEDLSGNKAKFSKRSSRSKGKAKVAAKEATKPKTNGKTPQPGLWEESSSPKGHDDAATDKPATQRGVSAGARKVRDDVYCAIIGALPPKEQHLEALEKKGVMREAAHHGRFASLDAKAVNKLVPELAERFGQKRLLSVPGFELDGRGEVRLSMASGSASSRGGVSDEYLLLPCFDAEGLLIGLEGLLYDPKSGEISAEETMPLKGAGSHLYVFAAYEPRQLEGLCEGPLGVLLAAQDDVVLGAIGGFRRYKAASGPGEGRQPVDAVLPELADVNFGERTIAYAPRAGEALGEANARYHETAPAARWLIEHQNGRPTIVALEDAGNTAGRSDILTSLAEWIRSLPQEQTAERLRELFPKSPAVKYGASKTEDHKKGSGNLEASNVEPPDERRTAAVQPLPALPTYGAVGLAAVAGSVSNLSILRLRDFAGYVDVAPSGDPLLHPGALGPVRRLLDSAPFQILYGLHWFVGLAAALLVLYAVLSKASESHRARLSAERMRLEERWELHLTPVTSAPSKALLTPAELLWTVLTWPLAYLASIETITGVQSLLSLAARWQLAPDVGTLVTDPARASIYVATALSAFVLWQRRSIRAAEARMLQGRIRH